MLCHLLQPPIAIIVPGASALHYHFWPVWHWSSWIIWKQETCDTSLHPTMPPIKNVREQISNFIKPLFLLIILLMILDMVATEHISANTFKIISKTYPSCEGGLIVIIFVVHLTTIHLWFHKMKTKHLSDCVIVSDILSHHDCFGVECVISLCNLAKNLIKQLPDQCDFTCWHIMNENHQNMPPQIVTHFRSILFNIYCYLCHRTHCF